MVWYLCRWFKWFKRQNISRYSWKLWMPATYRWSHAHRGPYTGSRDHATGWTSFLQCRSSCNNLGPHFHHLETIMLIPTSIDRELGHSKVVSGGSCWVLCGGALIRTVFNYSTEWSSERGKRRLTVQHIRRGSSWTSRQVRTCKCHEAHQMPEDCSVVWRWMHDAASPFQNAWTSFPENQKPGWSSSLGSTRERTPPNLPHQRDGYWLSRIAEYSSQPRKLWKTFSSVMGLDNVSSNIPTGSHSAQSLIDYLVKKIEDIRSSTGQSPPTTNHPEATIIFNSFRTYSVDEVRKVVLSKPIKSFSLDPIPGSILREFLPDLLPRMTTMCNRSIEAGWLPRSQRHAVVKPILKKDGLDQTDVKNFQSIANLTFTSKLVEWLINLQLTEFLEWNNLPPKFQSGFRKRHSTETALLKVMSDILLAADQGHVTLLGLLDMSAAFDTVDHDILLFRLKTSYGVDETVLSWLESFLRDRTQQVAFNGQSSVIVKVTSGVPQRSILEPLLFLLRRNMESTSIATRTMDSCICLTRRVLWIPSYKVWPIASLRSTTGCLWIDLNWTRTKRNSTRDKTTVDENKHT